jgi:hypothetical protein
VAYSQVTTLSAANAAKARTTSASTDSFIFLLLSLVNGFMKYVPCEIQKQQLLSCHNDTYGENPFCSMGAFEKTPMKRNGML